MYVDFFYWHYVAAPRWLVHLAWLMQRAVWQFFSVRVMVQTLFAHWHKDRLSYRQGSISGILQALALNSISRAVGFVIRMIVLGLFIVVEAGLLVISLTVTAAFLVWPLLTAVLIVLGLALLVRG